MRLKETRKILKYVSLLKKGLEVCVKFKKRVLNRRFNIWQLVHPLEILVPKYSSTGK